MRKVIMIAVLSAVLSAPGAVSGAVQAEAITLRCTASPAFNPLNNWPNETSATFRIEGSTVTIYSPERAAWVVHPCVHSPGDGQYCEITPTRMIFKQSHVPVAGIVDSRRITIDRRTGSFEVHGVVTGPTLFKEWRAVGTCAPGEAPAPPATRF